MREEAGRGTLPQVTLIRGLEICKAGTGGDKVRCLETPSEENHRVYPT